ncbi:hypothetical protein GDO86_006282 [Hymenochirus boettgeri]|uniref:Protein FAM214A n=1 Tax=Hymenochirus boettgeri TaxID=247094 RepID=A0A8T2JDC7_9PIPI|nr:hypothetical protein GDO86_006282 [Hymenochirus boettgeri]
MKPDRDSLDEFFEYEAEDFLVYLALLITEGRTPEHSVKGRTEGFHCPPAQSNQPGPNKHECSDKLAQCQQARKTRSEVALLWKNNIPIMVEVLLLPDCCYSDEGANSDANDLDDPALKQDALLLERWTLEPVPRQSGDRFIEEKTLLLAIRSFVFFSQLSAWLSVSHGAVPRNILYRVRAANGNLQLNFSHSPTEHIFPVPNVSHSVALKVSVQSLPRQSNYPVLNCSIHSSLGFYEKKMAPHDNRITQDSQGIGQHIAPGCQLTCTKENQTTGHEGLFQTRKNLSSDNSLVVKSSNLFSSADTVYTVGTSQSKLHCFNMNGNCKAIPQEPSVRNFKSFSLVGIPCNSHPTQPMEANPLIGSLIQERQEVIARIAQHLLQCDQSSSQLNSHTFRSHELNPISAKTFKNVCEDEKVQIKSKEKEILPTCSSNLDLTLTHKQNRQLKKTDTPINSTRPIPEFKTSPKPQARRKLFLLQSDEPLCNTYQIPVSKHSQFAGPLSNNNGKESTCNTHQRLDFTQSEISANKVICNSVSSSSNTNDRLCFNKHVSTEEKKQTDSSQNQQKDNFKYCSRKAGILRDPGVCQTEQVLCRPASNISESDHPNQLLSIENCINKDKVNIHYREPQDKLKIVHDENEDPKNCDCWTPGQRKCSGHCLQKFEQLKNTDQVAPVQPRHSSIWKKHTFRSLDGISTKAFHPCTGLPLLSSPVPQRKTQSGYFDLDTSLLQIKGLSTQRPHMCLATNDEAGATDRHLSSSAPPAPCLSLLGNFEVFTFYLP